jgi:glycosyltransferase involved in cell wall biosynthesis
MNPLVTTIIPVYNRPVLLGEAVTSVLDQTYRPIEIVIVDDGSTDDTPAVCRRLADAHPEAIRVLSQDNAGPGAAREAGRLVARGDFLQYLDSDDRLQPEKFARQVEALANRPECGVAYCKTREYVAGNEPDECAAARTGERLDTLFPKLLSGRCWYTLTPLLRREVSDAVGPWSNLRQEEDWEYDARVGALGIRLVWVPEFLADACHHAGERASGGSLNNPVKMRGRCEAHELIYAHARRAGIGPEDAHMQRFARELFLLARQCGAAGLAAESGALFRLAREASGEQRANGLDFRLYGWASACLGWDRTGWMACLADRFRGG